MKKHFFAMIAILIVVTLGAVYITTSRQIGKDKSMNADMPVFFKSTYDRRVMDPTHEVTEAGPLTVDKDVIKNLGKSEIDVKNMAATDLMEVVKNRSYAPVTRNNAANQLLNQRDARLSVEMMRMLSDETESITWRNYCIQFLKVCYEQHPAAEVATAMLVSCSDKAPEISSCAIWSLAQLAVPRNGPTHLSDAEVKQIQVMAYASLNSENLLLRMGGAQSCARMGMTGAVPELRSIAEHAADTSLRTVAIASLAQLHDMESNALLQKLAADSNHRIQEAAIMALKVLAALSE